MIRLKTAGRAKPVRPLRWLAEAIALSARWLTVEVEVPVQDGTLRFRCRNAQSLRRAYTLLIKEPGTIAWLDSELRAGDVFLDVGANVGVYTLYAALRVGPRGHVIAVEPHLRNAVALIENVNANELQERVSVLSVALADVPTVARFEYREWQTGSSHSQLDVGAPACGGEVKLAQSIDTLVESGAIRPPHLIKVDVDGLEPRIVAGMTDLLRGPQRPRSVQVECDPANQDAIEHAMTDLGYRVRGRHLTMAGQKRTRAGANVEAITHNVLFGPIDCSRSFQGLLRRSE